MTTTARYTVTIWRDVEDDADVIGVENPSDGQLIQQLRKELQLGWDKAGIAGHFDISEIKRLGVRSHAENDLIEELLKCLAEFQAGSGYDRQDEIRAVLRRHGVKITKPA